MRPRRTGFALVDILVSSTLLVVVFFALMEVIPSALKSLRSGHDLIGGANVAQMNIDQYRYLAFSKLPPDGTVALPAVTLNGVSYQPRAVFTTRNAGYVRDVAVTVTWPSQQRSAASSQKASYTVQTSLYNFTNP
ncbi:MAG: hypothetical protein EB084_10705 [Proteobacteria bacterium]|nr:hypothetical protein [Pseudomonadota bacterium]